MIRLVIIIACTALLAGCASLGDIGKGAFRNRVSCTLGGQTMLFTSFWFRWLGITAEVDAADAAKGCEQVQPVILQIAPQPRGSGS